jgi:hypothetical protein
MQNSEKYQKAFEWFKQSYDYKMGGTQTVVLPNGKSKEFDDRGYYSGRGAKYNSSIRHDIKGEVKVSRKEYSEFLKMLKERELRIAENQRRLNDKNCRIELAKSKGIYSVDGDLTDGGVYVELSNEEVSTNTFDEKRLANTFDISIEDVELLKSKGKTYVFAETFYGEIFRLYHASLECNNLSIHVEKISQKEVDKFNHNEWLNAPFSKKIGQTNNKNHFVC